MLLNLTRVSLVNRTEKNSEGAGTIFLVGEAWT